MPPADDIQRALTGAWQMMTTGRQDGLRMLDLSADGFWNSFFAIVVALPPLVAGWAPIAAELTGADAGFSARLSVLVRLAIVDIGAWLLPLAALAAFAGQVGIRDRFVHYVVATNWGAALFAWFMLPAALLRLFRPDAGEFAVALSLGIFFACLVLAWRLTNAALGKGAAMASGVFTAMLLASFITLFTLQNLLGIAPQ